MTKTGTAKSHEMRFKNLFLEFVACDIRHADKYWIRPKMSAPRLPVSMYTFLR